MFHHAAQIYQSNAAEDVCHSSRVENLPVHSWLPDFLVNSPVWLLAAAIKCWYYHRVKPVFFIIACTKGFHSQIFKKVVNEFGNRMKHGHEENNYKTKGTC